MSWQPLALISSRRVSAPACRSMICRRAPRSGGTCSSPSSAMISRPFPAGFWTAAISGPTPREWDLRRHTPESTERNDFASIPGGLLARGYLRAYASEVGLPPEVIAGRYRTEFGRDAPPLAEAYKHRTDAWDLSHGDHSNGPVVLVILIAIVGAWLYVSQRPRTEIVQQPGGTGGGG